MNHEILMELTSSPMFGVALCIVTFAAGVFFHKKLGPPIVNPPFFALGLAVVGVEVF